MLGKLFVMANKLTTAGNAILLQYTAPVYVALFGYMFLGERSTIVDWGTIAILLIGLGLFFIDDLSLDGFTRNKIFNKTSRRIIDRNINI